MEVVQFVPQLGKALWNLKSMYDQHVENGNEIKELQSFIQDYDHQIPILRERFQKGGVNAMGIAAFKNLERDVIEATNKLERWARNKSFFRVFNYVERMQKLEKLHSKVMASVQKSLGIANLSMLLDMQATQATILESNAELKSLLITSIGSKHGMLPIEVRDEVVEASTSSFGDPKFWEDVLAAVDNHNATISLQEEKNIYEDPITTNLMIDPVVASDGNTYCRWTIIDHNLTTNPFNVDEDLTIVIDNLTFRRGLFEKFPEQVQIFRQRRKQYRSHALSLKAKGLWGDAVLALHYVLQWDKRDVECIEALEQVQEALQEAKEKYLQPSIEPSNEDGDGEQNYGFTLIKEFRSNTMANERALGVGTIEKVQNQVIYESYSDSSDNSIGEVATSSDNSIGPESSSTRKIHPRVDEEHSIKDIQDNSEGRHAFQQQIMSEKAEKASGMSGFIQKLRSRMTNEKKKKKDLSTFTKFYGSKLKHPLPQLKEFRKFSSSDIKRMTNDFSSENIIPHEGSYTVHKGLLLGTNATISVTDFGGNFEAFKMELELVSRVHHKNVVAVLGYCLEQNPMLIYEHPNNGSLLDHLHDNTDSLVIGSSLNWRRRLRIALNVAQGLEYVHMDCSPSIVHGNVTSNNILLTPELDAKLANFELVKAATETDDTRVTTEVMGTAGYLDPEYYATGRFTTKSDVYSFGVVLLELITRRLPIYESTLTTMEEDCHITQWVRRRLGDGNIDSILAPIVKAWNPNIEAVWKVAEIAMRSVEPRSLHRPIMVEVVKELVGAMTIEAAALR